VPRRCTVCTSDARAEIDRALVGGTPYRRIAKRLPVSEQALLRHHDGHVPEHLAKARQAAEIADADKLLARLQRLLDTAEGLLAKAAREGDYRTALSGIGQARACLELLLEVEGRVDRRPQVNLLVAPEWILARSALLEALAPYPEARAAVAARLLALDAPNGHRD
jgi:hypothetical protein